MAKFEGISANTETPEAVRTRRDVGRGQRRPPANVMQRGAGLTSVAETKARDVGAERQWHVQIYPKN